MIFSLLTISLQYFWIEIKGLLAFLLGSFLVNLSLVRLYSEERARGELSKG